MPIDKTSAQISAILAAGGYVALPSGNILRPGDAVPTQAQLDAGLYDSPQAAAFGSIAIAAGWTGPALSRATAALGAGVMGAAYVNLPRAFSLTDIACEVTAGVAATFVRMGVYADSGGYPGGLVPGSDTGQIDASVAGVKTFTYGTPIALPAGRYWLCGVSQGGTPTVAISSTAGQPGIFTNSAATYVQAAQLAGYFASGITGALPATYPAGPVGNSSVHRVAIKVT